VPILTGMSAPSLFVTPYGRVAAIMLRERVAAAKADDPLRAVSVLVPTNYVGVSLRRMLASGALGPVTARGRGIVGLSLLTVYRLAELLGAPALAAAGRRPVSTPLLGAVVREVLRSSPGIFAPVVEHPSTEQALVRAYRELSQLTPDALDRLAASSVARVRHVVRIHRRVRATLATDWYDEADLMAAAAAAVRARSAVLDDIGTVIVHLPQELSVAAGALLSTLAEAAPVEVIAGMTGAADADADVVTSLRRLGVVPPPPAVFALPDVDEVVSVSDAEEEARTAVARVCAAVDEGVPLARIAITYPQREPYARVLHEQLTAAGIAYNGDAVRPVSDHVVGRWLLDLLALPDGEFARPAVMGLLTSAPVVSAGGRRLPTTTWERISRDAGVVRGRHEWADRLERLADRYEQRADRPDPDAPAWRPDRDRRTAERARQLATAVGELGRDLDRAGRLDRWAPLATWARGMLARWISRRRDAWPLAEREAADRVDAALDRLAGLDAAESSTDLETFGRALAAELDDDLARVGQLGEGVLVGTPASVFGVDLDVVIVLGMAEGLTPTRPREDSLLPDVARRTVDGQLRPRDDRVGIEHRHLLATLAAAHRRRVLVFPRGDLRRSVEHAPSRWLGDAVQQLHGHRALPATAPWLSTVPSFAGRMRVVAEPVTARQYALRALADATAGMRPVGVLPASEVVDAALARAAEVVRQRASGEFGRFTGRLQGEAARLVARHLDERVTSATALEQYLDCPHAYLLGHVLGVGRIDSPEELLRITPLERGSLVHDVLDRWLRQRIDEGTPQPDQPWPQAAVSALAALTDAALDDAERRGVTGHRLLWSVDRARIAADLADFVSRDTDRRRRDGLVPDVTELAFGYASGLPELDIAVGPGRRLRVRGFIDRVDVAADGAVYVADYKTGRVSSRYRDVADDPLGGGHKLQLPIYGLAVRQRHGGAPRVHAEYWFITHEGDGTRIVHELTDDTDARLRDVLRLVVDGISGGRFPMRPPDKPSYGYVRCEYCDPDGLGTAELRRTWERVRCDPALHDYVALVEPDAVVGTAPAGAST
jgi:ATP-dependent helicase/nuclease subunit B